jgi:hypothetical protein
MGLECKKPRAKKNLVSFPFNEDELAYGVIPGSVEAQPSGAHQARPSQVE